NQTLGGQIAWLLPFALLGMVALAWQKRPRFPLEDREQLSLVLWGMWLLTMGIFFSVASFFHEYYLTEMAPAVGALFGIGAVVMWRDYRSSGWRGWLLPLAIAVTGATQIYILSSFPDWSKWLTPLIAAIGGIAVIVLVVARLVPRITLSAKNFHYTSAAFCVAALALLIAPTVWAAIPMLNHSESQLPIAGPEQAASGMVLYISGPGGTERIDMPGRGQLSNAGGPGGMGMRGGEADQKLIQYLEKNQGNAKYLVATPSSQTADSIILATNKPVMALGGFSGSDPTLTQDELAALVKNGTVRFFLIGGMGAGGTSQSQDQQQDESTPGQGNGGPGGGALGPQSTLTSWVQNHCTSVPTSEWQSSSSGTTGGGNGLGRADQLYDCGSTH
ncbi:MAG: glycosyltransferase family 39 protein, partial [Ktedonobacteraceae bacterium]|nr:glycosyltransferase family 39 protein [Ktedonobacteraceae bacterium]